MSVASVIRTTVSPGHFILGLVTLAAADIAETYPLNKQSCSHATPAVSPIPPRFNQIACDPEPTRNILVV